MREGANGGEIVVHSGYKLGKGSNGMVGGEIFKWGGENRGVLRGQ